MIQLLYLINLSLTLIFIFLEHPLSMGLTLLAQASSIALITGLLSLNFWFSYILFIIMVGGMLVLFIYMTSIASNEKFKFSASFIPIMAFSSMLMISSILMDKMLIQIKFLNSDILVSPKMSLFQMSMSKYLNFPSNLVMALLIIYLLITLIAVVKITNISYGPLRHQK